MTRIDQIAMRCRIRILASLPYLTLPRLSKHKNPTSAREEPRERDRSSCCTVFYMHSGSLIRSSIGLGLCHQLYVAWSLNVFTVFGNIRGCMPFFVTLLHHCGVLVGWLSEDAKVCDRVRHYGIKFLNPRRLLYCDAFRGLNCAISAIHGCYCLGMRLFIRRKRVAIFFISYNLRFSTIGGTTLFPCLKGKFFCDVLMAFEKNLGMWTSIDARKII